MPVDKQNNVNKSSKPVTPSLTSRFRNVKAPLTPKLASSTPSSPANSPRRDLPNRPASSGRDTTPISPLNDNVTARSGARNSRIGTESPVSPGGRKIGSASRPRASSINESSKRIGYGGPGSVGLGISSPGTRVTVTPRPKSAILSASTPFSGAGQLPPKEADNDAISPQFFRADTIKATSGVQERQKPLGKAATFACASRSTPNLTSPPLERIHSISPPSQNTTKFFRADDVLQNRLAHAKEKSVTSIESPQRSPELRAKSRINHRPPSPLKNSVSSNQTQRRSPIPSPPVTVGTPYHSNRRQSIESNISTLKLATHVKSPSSGATTSQDTPTRRTGSLESTIDSQKDMQAQEQSQKTTQLVTLQLPLSPEAFSPLSPRSTSLTSSNTIATSDTDHSEIHRLHSLVDVSISSLSLLSPPSQAQSQGHQPQQSQSELAANARRERKVLDLEISNSSLLAINKTLERELRKQSTELRRFRRLSRSGRLSIANNALPMRHPSAGSALTTLSEDEAELEKDVDDVIDSINDLDLDSSESSDPDDEDVNDHNSARSTTSLTFSPDARARRRRARDEKRLMLDLSQHHQLLIESQKLSQSIRRCMGWTEEMIREAKRALEYRVAVGDITLGGRVLREEDVENDEHGTGDYAISTALGDHGEGKKGQLHLTQSTRTGTLKTELVGDNLEPESTNLYTTPRESLLWYNSGPAQMLDKTTSLGQFSVE